MEVVICVSILCGLGLACALFEFLHFILFETKQEECSKNQIFEKDILFSTTEYFDRIEKAYNEILEQKERQSDSEEYVIILWWGLDGLRLNKDGSREWISKRKEEPVFSIPIYPQYNAFAINPLINPLNYQLQQCCCAMDYINRLQAQCTQSTQSQILELQELDRQLQLQIAQSEQMGNILKEIKVPTPITREIIY